MTRKHERNGLSRRQQRKIRRRCWAAAMDVLVELGFGGLARAVEILVNEAMQLEQTAGLAWRWFLWSSVVLRKI